jgi:hypothetical protein
MYAVHLAEFPPVHCSSASNACIEGMRVRLFTFNQVAGLRRFTQQLRRRRRHCTGPCVTAGGGNVRVPVAHVRVSG